MYCPLPLPQVEQAAGLGQAGQASKCPHGTHMKQASSAWQPLHGLLSWRALGLGAAAPDCSGWLLLAPLAVLLRLLPAAPSASLPPCCIA